jgi:hypothetical protein
LIGELESAPEPNALARERSALKLLVSSPRKLRCMRLLLHPKCIKTNRLQQGHRGEIDAAQTARFDFFS